MKYPKYLEAFFNDLKSDANLQRQIFSLLKGKGKNLKIYNFLIKAGYITKNRKLKNVYDYVKHFLNNNTIVSRKVPYNVNYLLSSDIELLFKLPDLPGGTMNLGQPIPNLLYNWISKYKPKFMKVVTFDKNNTSITKLVYLSEVPELSKKIIQRIINTFKKYKNYFDYSSFNAKGYSNIAAANMIESDFYSKLFYFFNLIVGFNNQSKEEVKDAEFDIFNMVNFYFNDIIKNLGVNANLFSFNSEISVIKRIVKPYL